MTESFRKSLNKIGYQTAQYRGELYFWTKTHYAKLELSTLSYFIQEHWMNKACVDKKKASAKNAKEIIDNILNTARPLDFVRRDDARRIVNFKNGTLFISKNGVRTFKPMHDPRDATLNILEFNYDKKCKMPQNGTTSCVKFCLIKTIEKHLWNLLATAFCLAMILKASYFYMAKVALMARALF